MISKKNILIMGCSVGVPNYFGSPGVPAEHHIEYLLKEQGHVVHNCSFNGGSNLLTLERSKQFLKGNEISHPAFRDQKICLDGPWRPDLIIWFHTALYRDYDGRSLQALASDVYSRYADFFRTWSCGSAVIGGGGDIHDELFSWMTPDFCVPSWRRVIFARPDLPLDYGILPVIDKLGLTVEEKVQILQNLDELFSCMNQSEHYPDGSHPGTVPHADLFRELASCFDL